MLCQSIYEAGSWEIDGARRELRAHGRAVPIGSRAFEIIEKLAAAAGRFVSKDELVAHVWRGVTVEENTLRVHIHAIRKALGADRTMLKTAPGRGYRLVGPWAAKQNEARADAARRSPARLPQQRPRNNLPAASSDLVGRTAEMHQLRDLVTAFRVVTLAGPGGIGKTALAIELARSVIAEFDGVCFVELASLADASLMPATVVAALGLAAEGKAVTSADVGRAIGNASILLILDNCEHMVDAVAVFIEQVVRLCPRTAILVTSREVIRIDGERIYRVPPLGVPDRTHVEQETLLGFSAVELFVTRTQALDDRFSLAAGNSMAVATICRDLDGIPLAIEFAAARAATLGVHQVSAGLRDRFGLLNSRRRTALPRHRTLRAVLDWSFELLSVPERTLLRRLAIFAGYFDLSDIAAVTPENSVIERLSSLIDKSLVVTEHRGAITLYRLLETTRAYAVDKLDESGERNRVSRQHAEHYRDVLERIEPEWQARPQSDLQANHAWRVDNLRVALDWAFSESGDASIGISLAIAAVPLWLHLSALEECRRRIEQALAIAAATDAIDTRQEMKLRTALGASLAHSGGSVVDAEIAYERAHSLADSIGDVDYQLRSLWGLWMLRQTGALEIARRFSVVASTPTDRIIGDRMMMVSNHFMGNVAEAGRYAERVMVEAPAQYASNVRIRYVIAQQPVVVGRIVWLQGYPDRAMDIAARAVEEATAAGHANSLCHVLAWTACRVALWTGDLDRAERYINLLADQATAYSLGPWLAWSRCYQGVLADQRGAPLQGAALIRAGFDELRTLYPWNRVVFFLGDLAVAWRQGGRIESAMAAIEEAIDEARRTSEVWSGPELLRIKGEILRLSPAHAAEGAAEACFQQALEEARRQGALAWELRVATSLAGLLYDGGRAPEATRLLRPVYGRFTEGMHTPDLKAARDLLERLPS